MQRENFNDKEHTHAHTKSRIKISHPYMYLYMCTLQSSISKTTWLATYVNPFRVISSLMLLHEACTVIKHCRIKRSRSAHTHTHTTTDTTSLHDFHYMYVHLRAGKSLSRTNKI